MTGTETTTLDAARMTRAQRAALPLSTEVAQALAEEHGVCVRPLAMRRIDTATGRVDIVPVPCGSTREDQCPALCGQGPAVADGPMPRGLAP
ncbi:MAG: hypothetical protein M3460_18475 [Actinomycetota bacterium]|nr:hypothetical protein [Actinomycetota bacterium]